MSLSMTGYGAAAAEVADKKITAEMRSLNSKQLDANIKIPPEYRELENDVRLLLQVLQRGKIDVQVSVRTLNPSAAQPINEDLFMRYLLQLNRIAEKYDGTRPDVSRLRITAGDILALPEVVANTETSVSPEEKEALLNCCMKAAQELTEYRRQEGVLLMNDIMQRVRLIEHIAQQIAPMEKERMEIIKARVQQSLSSIDAASIDANRFEQELIYYLEKLDITEEKTRLNAHCHYFGETAKEEGTGRKLGFIVQEMGREINTIGSKANHSGIQHLVVQMKDELEKIKEQLLNIL